MIQENVSRQIQYKSPFSADAYEKVAWSYSVGVLYSVRKLTPIVLGAKAPSDNAPPKWLGT